MEEVGGEEAKGSAGRSVNWFNLFGGHLEIRIKTLGNGLPFDPETVFSGKIITDGLIQKFACKEVQPSFVTIVINNTET